MALTETTVIDKVEVLLESRTVQVRRATRIVRDDTEIVSQTYHRVAYAPTDDVSHEDPRVQAIVQVARES